MKRVKITLLIMFFLTEMGIYKHYYNVNPQASFFLMIFVSIFYYFINKMIKNG